MRHQFDAQLLTIYVGEQDKFQSGLLYAAIVEHLMQAGMAGVTVLQAVEGFGAQRKLHTTRFEALFASLPVVIQAVDAPEKVEAALAILDGMLDSALVTVQDVSAFHYSQR